MAAHLPHPPEALRHPRTTCQLHLRNWRAVWLWVRVCPSLGVFLIPLVEETTVHLPRCRTCGPEAPPNNTNPPCIGSGRGPPSSRTSPLLFPALGVGTTSSPALQLRKPRPRSTENLSPGPRSTRRVQRRARIWAPATPPAPPFARVAAWRIVSPAVSFRGSPDPQWGPYLEVGP